MARRIEDARLMAKVASLYYQQNMRQSEIASRLDLSQAGVSRLLKRALDEGIVRITISTPAHTYSEIEMEIERRYGLKEAIVVDYHDDPQQLLHNLGAAGGHYLETTIKDGEHIGVSSWSETLLAVARSMQPLNRSIHAHVIQVLGGVGNPTGETHAVQLTRRLAKLVNGDITLLPAPGVVGSRETRDVLLADPYIAASAAMFDKVTLALVGIGAVEPSHLLALSGNVFSSDELTSLRELGAVGDICLRFIDRTGVPVDSPFAERVIGMSLEQLRRTPRTVAVAGGKRKSAAIKAAVLGGWVHVLITDYRTARSMLED